MSTLGIGVRVWVGWCPDYKTAVPGEHRPHKGVIVRGPILPGVYGEGDKAFRVIEMAWVVETQSGKVGAIESMLTPIDDGETQETEQREEVTA